MGNEREQRIVDIKLKVVVLPVSDVDAQYMMNKREG
jgi:hypothetical protein